MSITQRRLVWFKRDLRIEDHAPLSLSDDGIETLFLYVFEPELLGADDHDASHCQFIIDSLDELRERIHQLGGRLLIRIGQVPSVFESLWQSHPFQELHSHQETGNGLTYARDRRVLAWVRQRGVRWVEHRQHGVVRRLKDRDGWARQWSTLMRQPLHSAPERLVSPIDISLGDLPSLNSLGVADSPRVGQHLAGEHAAHVCLRDFLRTRGERYRQEMSSPNTAVHSCSRLSAHLAYGNISMRMILKSTEARQTSLRQGKKMGSAVGPNWLNSLASFSKRLRWHCHFMQKLEDQPAIEFENMASIYDGIRESEFSQERYEAWCEGRTGFPMVDACMRSLNATGWINFRMRAMLVSFAAYHLWLHWRPVALHLATRFIDYEPGIHYSQCQMQSGTTGINALRIYSPSKQCIDHDPEGVFIKTWVPELRSVPAEFLADPSRMSDMEQVMYGCRLDADYPAPIVDARRAVARAKRKMYGVRRTDEAKREAAQVFAKHGSRRRPRRR